MIKYATRLPPGKGVELLDNGLVRKTEHRGFKEAYQFMVNLINHFISHPDPLVVRVHELHILPAWHGMPTYAYDMDQCGILSADERAFINRVGALWDEHQTRACQQDDPGLLYYKASFPKLFEFLKTVVEQDRYLDLHSGNVMMNPDGDYCLIDLEGFLKFPLERSSNDWVLK